MSTNRKDEQKGQSGSGTGSRKSQRTIDLKANQADDAKDRKAEETAKSAPSGTMSGKPAGQKESAAATPGKKSEATESAASKAGQGAASGSSAKAEQAQDRTTSKEPSPASSGKSGAEAPKPAGQGGRKEGAAARSAASRPVYWVGVFIAALLGGAVAVGGMLALGMGPGSRDGGEISAALEEFAGRIQAGEGERQQLASRLTEQGGEIESLAARVGEPGAAESQLQPIRDRLAELEEQLQAAESPLSQGPGATPDSGGAAAAGVDNSGLEDLERRLSALEARLGGAGDAGEAGGGAVPSEISDQMMQNREDIASLDTRLGEFESRLEQLSQRLETNAADEAEAAGNAQRMARRVAAQALTSAYHNGDPYSQFLDSLAVYASDSQALETLRGQAETGVATAEELQRGYEASLDRILQATDEPAEGVVDRLMQSARSLVTVRPAGPVEGNEPRALVWQIERDVAASRFAAALEKWQSLPEDARSAAADWGDTLRARVEADAALSQILSQLEGDS